uniref:Uncharacterized protein n=1 Tax=Candidatus Kentrum sp. LFY TaxID=2126342 RepID=A0A450WLQ3_9GAMM|nr:MAG: hypothetical protein BECKLFY1418C_GA0070996_103717 [Candidatus Kentron sp. LFY]
MEALSGDLPNSSISAINPGEPGPLAYSYIIDSCLACRALCAVGHIIGTPRWISQSTAWKAESKKHGSKTNPLAKLRLDPAKHGPVLVKRNWRLVRPDPIVKPGRKSATPHAAKASPPCLHGPQPLCSHDMTTFAEHPILPVQRKGFHSSPIESHHDPDSPYDPDSPSPA